VLARITFKDASGAAIYSTARQIHIADPYDKYDLVKGVYTDMVNRLKAGTPSTALNLFFGHAKAIYEGIFNKLGSNLSTMADQLGTVESLSISPKNAELVIVRDPTGAKKAFMIYLMKGQDGIWRIESM
jgi:hypothetical protein